MYFMLIYDYVEDYLERREPLRDQHLSLAKAAYEKGDIVMAGALMDPVDGAVITHTLAEATGLGPHFQKVNRPERAAELMEQIPAEVIFIGHTHEPGWWALRWGRPAWHPATPGTRLELLSGRRYLINVGSLGEPNTPTSATHVLWDGGSVVWRGL